MFFFNLGYFLLLISLMYINVCSPLNVNAIYINNKK